MPASETIVLIGDYEVSLGHISAISRIRLEDFGSTLRARWSVILTSGEKIEDTWKEKKPGNFPQASNSATVETFRQCESFSTFETHYQTVRNLWHTHCNSQPPARE